MDRESVSYLIPEGEPDPLTRMTVEALWEELYRIEASRFADTALYRSMLMGIINELKRRGEWE